MKYLDDEITAETYRRQSEGIGVSLVALSLELSRLDLSRESNIGLFEQLMRLSTDFESAFEAAGPRLRRAYLSLCWEKLVVRDRQIVEAYPTPVYAMALAMLEGSDAQGNNAQEKDTKKSPRLHSARSAQRAGAPAQQVGGTVIKTQGWLPQSFGFYTFPSKPRILEPDLATD